MANGDNSPEKELPPTLNPNADSGTPPIPLHSRPETSYEGEGKGKPLSHGGGIENGIGIGIGADVDTEKAAFWDAVDSGDPKFVLNCIQEHPEWCHLRDVRGFTPLHRVSEVGHSAVARILIEKSKAELDDIAGGTETGTGTALSPLHLACFHSHFSIVSLLLDAGASAEIALPTGHTALHMAAMRDNRRAVELLIEHGADVNARTQFLNTPLHLAAWWGHASTASLLVSRGADLGARDRDSFTPLHKAAIAGHGVAIRLLCDLGADANVRDRDGMSPLHHAVMHEKGLYDTKTSAVRALVRGGADTNMRDKNGMTPLWMATKKGAMGCDVVALCLAQPDPVRSHPTGAQYAAALLQSTHR